MLASVVVSKIATRWIEKFIANATAHRIRTGGGGGGGVRRFAISRFVAVMLW